MIKYDLSDNIPEPEWNYYGSEYSKKSPRLTSLQIQWDGLTGLLDGTIELEISNMVTRKEDEADEFVTKIPLLDSNGNIISLNKASNKLNCHIVVIDTPHAGWRLQVDKGNITGGILKALMIEPSNG